MFQGMSNENRNDRWRDDRAHEKADIQSWLDGQGGVIMGIFLIVLIWAIVSQFVG